MASALPAAASNSTAALDLLAQARRATIEGDDAKALRLVNQSLKLHDSEEGRTLKKHYERFGPNSPAAAAVARMLEKRSSYYDKLQLGADATPEHIKKAYKQLSLLVHPDRNHARRADEAFKALSQAFSVLGDASARAAYDRELRKGGPEFGPFAHDYAKRWQQRKEREAQYASSGSEADKLRAELEALRSAQAERERQHQQEVQAARRQGFAEARESMSRLDGQVAAAEKRNSALRKELETERLGIRKAEQEREALAAAVRALASKLKQGKGASDGGKFGDAPAWRSVSGEAEMRVLLAEALQRTVQAALSPLHEALYA